MVRIRLRRVGAKKQPSYRVVAADKESPRDGRFLEVLGFYNPRTEPSTINFTEDRVYHWLSVGAQPSDSVRRLFDQAGLWDRYQRFKDGEDLDKLLAEAAAAEEARDVDPRTRRDDLPGKAKKAAKPTDEVEAVEEAEVAEVAVQADKVKETEEPEEAPEADEAEEVEEAVDTEQPEETSEEPEAVEEVAEAEVTEEVPEAEEADEAEDSKE